MQLQTKWSPPRPVRWGAWLALYVLAIGINKKYANVILTRLDLDGSVLWHMWTVSVLPAVLVVTVLLLIRCIWYQIWLIYQRDNQYIYNEKVLSNQQYWSEYALLADVIFCCGQLNQFVDFYNYLSLSE